MPYGDPYSNINQIVGQGYAQDASIRGQGIDQASALTQHFIDAFTKAQQTAYDRKMQEAQLAWQQKKFDEQQVYNQGRDAMNDSRYRDIAQQNSEDRQAANEDRALNRQQLRGKNIFDALNAGPNDNPQTTTAMIKSLGGNPTDYGTQSEVPGTGSDFQGPVTPDFPATPSKTQMNYQPGSAYTAQQQEKQRLAAQFQQTDSRMAEQANQAHLDRMAMLASKNQGGGKNDVPPGTDTEAMANQLLAGKTPWPSNRQWMLPEWKEAYQIALAKDPSFNAGTYKMRADMQQEATKGKLGATAESGTTLIKHLDSLLSHTTQAGDPTTTRLGNTIVNALRRNAPGGSPDLASAAMDTNAVADEMERFYTQQGTEGGRRDWKAEFDINNPLAARKASIQAAAKLISGKITAGQERYNRGMGKFGDQKLIDPTTQAALERIGVMSPGASMGSPSPSPGGGSAPKISSQAEYEALPSGSLYTAKDGTVGRKP